MANRAAGAALGPALEGACLLDRMEVPGGLRRYLRLAAGSVEPVPSVMTRRDGSTSWNVDASSADAEGTLVLLHLRMRADAVPVELRAKLEHLHQEIERREELERERCSLLALERRAREQAEQACRLKDEWLASVSHELRTPLHAIAGWVALMRHQLSDPELVRRGLDVIERAIVAQTQLTEDLLDVSRAITGRMRLDVRTVDLALVARQALEAGRPAADAKGIGLELCTDDGEHVIRGDPDRLLQILWNLISNATKHTERGGRITVTVRRGTSHVEVAVSDNGRGITAELLPFVFDRFCQADDADARRSGGLGLGLSIVRHLVELHGGVAMAHSDGPGQGATFTVSLPRPMFRRTSAVTLPAVAVGEVHGDELLGLRVLLVEDHRDARELLEGILRAHGAEVVGVEGSARAQQVFGAQRFDAVLSDLEMPDEDGFTLIRKLRRLERQSDRSRTPAVAVSAHTVPSARVHALRAGFQAFTAKPVDPFELVALLASLCDASGAVRALSSGDSRSLRTQSAAPR
ncbi:hybrid sensor histidine kinase/response regulator [Paraliomyxa miuraensis]|uniref:hybrid sensor histidine kinase/response regulator n=1 Tax=Paraliomyxa miuraensis TaxID=376150 RepID=UPI002252C65F|nr:ATP-binding protein [Paraliomyxa miuraensis]MCX4241368.1 ATP-binding protein [Paraliomyxa miuraensis]